MKRKLISIATTFTMSIMLLSSSAFANGPELGGVRILLQIILKYPLMPDLLQLIQ